jgi:hypothetical protein
MPYGNGGVSNVTSSLNQNFVDGDGDERGVLENVLHPWTLDVDSRRYFIIIWSDALNC